MESREKGKPNTVLRQQRVLRGWSLQHVADQVRILGEKDNKTPGVSADMVGRWERGEKIPSPFYREKFCTLYGLTAEQLSFVDLSAASNSTSTVQLQTAQKFPNAFPPNKLSGNNAAESGLNDEQRGMILHREFNGKKIRGESEQSAESDIEGDNEAMNPGRRNATKLIAAVAVGSTLMSHLEWLNQDALEQLSVLMTKSSNIDMKAVTSLGTITESHWQLVYGGVPKRDLLFGVQGHLQSVAHFLRGSLPTSIEQHLHAIASQQAQIMSEIYFDMHDYARAEAYSKLAIEAAQQANNPALYAVALARMSFLYTYSHQFKEALSLLQVAHRHAEQATEITICSWIGAMEAEVQANIFAYYHDIKASDACLRALDRAERITEQMGDDIYWTKFGSASLAGYKGICFKQLRKPVQAQSVLLEALKTISKDIPGGQATALTDLAGAYAQQGEIEEACNRATQALTIISKQSKSVNTLQRVCDFRLDLEQWASSAHVKYLDEQIAMTRIHLM